MAQEPEISQQTHRAGRKRRRWTMVLLATTVVAVVLGFPLARFTVLRSDREGLSATGGPPTGGPTIGTRSATPATPLPVPSGAFAFVAGALYPPAQIGIYRVSEDGTNLSIVVPKSSTTSVSWSPDGTKLAFSTGLSKGEGDLRIVNRDGTGEIVVSDFHEPHGMSWSPNGRVIAFTIGFAPFPYTIDPGDIYVIGVDGTGLTRLTHSGLPCSDLHAAWSPDGSELAFNRDCDPPSSIHVVNADGSDDRQILAIRRTAQGISWSPDGSLIAFSVIDPDRMMGIYTVAPDGGDLTMITEGFDVWPVWLSPEELAFVRNGEIWEVDISTREASRIVALPGLRVGPLSWLPG